MEAQPGKCFNGKEKKWNKFILKRPVLHLFQVMLEIPVSWVVIFPPSAE